MMRALLLTVLTSCVMGAADIALAEPERGAVALPAAAEPPPGPPETPFLTGVVWTEQPDAYAFARLYPQQAQEAGVEGRVVLDCLVAGNGSLTCVIQSEDPPGYGFGEATLGISQHFRAAPQTREGVNTAGARVRRAIRWLIAY